MGTIFCKHYRGMHGKTHCEVGVCFADVKSPRDGGGLDIPCVIPLSGKKPPDNCDKRQFPTVEEIEAEEKEIAELFGRTEKARGAIIKHTGGKRGVSGSIECPICNTGSLRYSVSGYNGHIHAGCTTEGCVSWME